MARAGLVWQGTALQQENPSVGTCSEQEPVNTIMANSSSAYLHQGAAGAVQQLACASSPRVAPPLHLAALQGHKEGRRAVRPCRCRSISGLGHLAELPTAVRQQHSIRMDPGPQGLLSSNHSWQQCQGFCCELLGGGQYVVLPPKRRAAGEGVSNPSSRLMDQHHQHICIWWRCPRLTVCMLCGREVVATATGPCAAGSCGSAVWC